MIYNVSPVAISVLIISLFASLCFNLREKERFSALFLFIAAFSLFWIAAHLDPYLNAWDERFHALVAKNMLNHPFKPTLYDDPVVNMAYDRWDRYHIWLHKQPLFLWQIVISFKIFGVSEYAVRYPDILLSSIFIVVIYRTGRLLAGRNSGWFAALFAMSSYYLTNLVSGRQPVDHNDVAFVVYVTLSIWSFLEYYYSRKTGWLILAGIFSGCAILCKWLVGLLVYALWIFVKILKREYEKRDIKGILIALFFTVLIALPWQLYCLINFPAEAMKAYNLNTMHFISAVDGQTGDVFFHLINIDNLYGNYISWLVLPSFFFFYKRCNDKKLAVSLMLMVVLVYLFFTAAATKMTSFTMVASIVIFIAIGTLADVVSSFLLKFIRLRFIKELIFILLVSGIFFARYLKPLRERQDFLKTKDIYSDAQIHNRKIFTSLDLNGNYILFNLPGRTYAEAMFYTNLPAYNFLPDKEQVDELRKKGRDIAVFCSMDQQLPQWIKADSSIVVIRKNVRCTD